jgi:hypothetical protein
MYQEVKRRPPYVIDEIINPPLERGAAPPAGAAETVALPPETAETEPESQAATR